MAVETHIHAGSGTWRNLDEFHIHAGSGTWRNLDEAWVHAGSGTWRKIFAASSCATASFDSNTSTWSETGCTDANECQLCMGANHTDCTDACHHLDGYVSVNGGSFTLVLSCRTKGCTNTTGTDCGGEFNCNTQSGGTRCWSNSNTHKPRLEIQRDADSSVDATWTYGSTYSGACIA